MIDYTEYHRLIEIVVNLNKTFEAEKRSPVSYERKKNNQKNKTMWINRMKKWIKYNYDYDGIDEEEE